MRPEQVQDFYPTPGTVSTCMFYTGLDPYTPEAGVCGKDPRGQGLQRALLQYYEPRNAEKVVKALKMTHREDLIPLLVPAVGRRAVQRTARRAEAAEVTIHNDGTYTVRPNQRAKRHAAHGQMPVPLPDRPSAQPGARFAPHSAPARKPKNDQQKENTTWKTGKKKKVNAPKSPVAAACCAGRCRRTGAEPAGCSGLPSVPGGSAGAEPVRSARRLWIRWTHP